MKVKKILFLNSLPRRERIGTMFSATWGMQRRWLKRLSEEGRVSSLSVAAHPLALLVLPIKLLVGRYDKVVVYNLMKRAPLGIVIKIAHFFKVPVTAIVFDIADEHQVKMAVALKDADERILITDAIAKDFAPGLPYVREDGFGLVSSCRGRCANRTIEQSNNRTTLVYAGAMREYNCIDLLLEYMEKHQESDLRLELAGHAEGVMLKRIQTAAGQDARIVYHGILGDEAVRALYDRASVLLCLRDPNWPLMKYHFPSKIFELMETGKPVIASNTGHMKETYGEKVFVLEQNTVSTLEEAIRRAVNG